MELRCKLEPIFISDGDTKTLEVLIENTEELVYSQALTGDEGQTVQITALEPIQIYEDWLGLAGIVITGSNIQEHCLCIFSNTFA